MSKQLYYRHEVTSLVEKSLANVVRNIMFNDNMSDAEKIATIKGAYLLMSEIDEETLEREKEEE